MDSHHARLLRYNGPYERSLLSVLGDELQQSEVLEYDFVQLGIDEVRTLVEDAYRRPSGTASQRLFVVRAGQLTNEAQQALLKLLEEPPQSSRFFFILPARVSLLPTLRSRFAEVGVSGSTVLLPPSEVDVWNEFLTASIPIRMSLLSSGVAEKDGDWLERFSVGFREYVATVPPTMRHRSTLAFVLSRLGTRGAANKMLLEELAFTIPVKQ